MPLTLTPSWGLDTLQPLAAGVEDEEPPEPRGDAPVVNSYDPGVERWRQPIWEAMPDALKQRPDSGVLLDKLLHAVRGESGGNPSVYGDGGAAYGLFQSHHIPGGSDPSTQINDAWRLVSSDLAQGGTGFGDWGEGRLYNGGPFGAFGRTPYGSGSFGGITWGGGGGAGAPVTPPVPTAPGPTLPPMQPWGYAGLPPEGFNQTDTRSGAGSFDLTQPVPPPGTYLDMGGQPVRTAPDVVSTTPPNPADYQTLQEQVMQATAPPPGIPDYSPLRNRPGPILQYRGPAVPGPGEVAQAPDAETRMRQVMALRDAFRDGAFGPAYQDLSPDEQRRQAEGWIDRGRLPPGFNLSQQFASKPWAGILAGAFITPGLFGAQQGLGSVLRFLGATAASQATEPIGETLGQQFGGERGRRIGGTVGGFLPYTVGQPLSNPALVAERGLPSLIGRGVAEAGGAALAGEAYQQAGGPSIPVFGNPAALVAAVLIEHGGGAVERGVDRVVDAMRETRVAARAFRGEYPDNWTQADIARYETAKAEVLAQQGGPPGPGAPPPAEGEVGRYRTPGREFQPVGGGANLPREQQINLPAQRVAAEPVNPQPPPADQRSPLTVPRERTQRALAIYKDPNLDNYGPKLGRPVEYNGWTFGVTNKPPEMRAQEVESTLSDEEIAQARKWYDEHRLPLAEVLSLDPDHPQVVRMMLAWLIGQQGITVEGGMENVLRNFDMVNGITRPESDYTKAGMGTGQENMQAFLKGLPPLPKGYAEKLSDFMDAALGSPTSTWMGHDPSGGGPYVPDIHMSKAEGYITNDVAEKLGLPPEAIDLPGQQAPDEKQVQMIRRNGNRFVAWANRTGWKGGDWKSGELQAVVWTAIRKALGTPNEGTLESAIKGNTREVVGRGDEQAFQRAKELVPTAELLAQPGKNSRGEIYQDVFGSREAARDVADVVAHQTGQPAAVFRPTGGDSPPKKNGVWFHDVGLPEGLSTEQTDQLERALAGLARFWRLADRDGEQVLRLIGTSLPDRPMTQALQTALGRAGLESLEVKLYPRQPAEAVIRGGVSSASSIADLEASGRADIARALERAGAAGAYGPPSAPTTTTGPSVTTGTGLAPDYGEARDVGNGLKSRYKPKLSRLDIPGRQASWELPTGVSNRPLTVTVDRSSADSTVYHIAMARAGASMAQERNAEGASAATMTNLGSFMTDLVEANPDAVFLNSPVGGPEGRRAATYARVFGFRDLTPDALTDLIADYNLGMRDTRELQMEAGMGTQYFDRNAPRRTDVTLPRELGNFPGGAVVPREGRGLRVTGGQARLGDTVYEGTGTTGPVSGITYTGTPGQPTRGAKAREIDAKVESGELTPGVAKNLKDAGLTWGDWLAMQNAFAPQRAGWEQADIEHNLEGRSGTVPTNEQELRRALRQPAQRTTGEEMGQAMARARGQERVPRALQQEYDQAAQIAAEERGTSTIGPTETTGTAGGGGEINITADEMQRAMGRARAEEVPQAGAQGRQRLPIERQPVQEQLPGMPERPETPLSPEEQQEYQRLQTEYDNWRAQSARGDFPPDWSRERVIRYQQLTDSLMGMPSGMGPGGPDLPPGVARGGFFGPDKRRINLLQEFGALLGIPQSMMAMLDISGTLRPGLRTGVVSPGAWKDALGKELQAFGSEAMAELTQKAVEADPWFQHGQDHGLHTFEWGPGVKAEDRVPGFTGENESWVAEQVAKRVPFFMASERARAVFLNWEGQKLYSMFGEAMSKTARFQRLSVEQQDKWFKELARGINIARGRGSVSFGNIFEGFNLLFSARNLGSLVEAPFQVLRAPGSLFEPSPRQFAAKSMAGTALSLIALMGFLGLTGAAAGGLWSVNADPLSGDFGQLRIGNTRFDATAGFGPLAKLILRAGFTAAGRGKPGETIGNDLVNFFRNKEAPIPALLTNFLTGVDALGKDFQLTPWTIASMYIPLITQAGGEAVLNNTGLNKLLALPTMAAEAVGIGGNTYQTQEDLRREYANKLYPGYGYTELDYGQQQAVKKAIESAGQAPAKTGVGKAAEVFKQEQADLMAGYERAWKQGNLGGKKLTDLWSDLTQQNLGQAKLVQGYYDDQGIDPGSDLAKRFSGLMTRYKAIASDPAVTDENGILDPEELRKRQKAFVENLPSVKQGGAVSDQALMQSYLDYAKSQKTQLQQQYSDYLDKKEKLGYEHVKPTDSDDEKRRKKDKNDQLDRDNPDIDAQAWLFNSGQKGASGGTLATKAAVDQALKYIDSQKLGNRQVHLGTLDRDLNSKEGKAFWEAEGQKLANLVEGTKYTQAYGDQEAALQYRRGNVKSPRYADLSPQEQQEVASKIRTNVLEGSPELDALWAYAGGGGNSTDKVYVLHNRAAIPFVQQLYQRYGRSAAKEGWQIVGPKS